MKKCIIKPVNYNMFQSITQDKVNHDVFQGRLVEIIKLYEIDPASLEGKIMLKTHFISQSASRI